MSRQPESTAGTPDGRALDREMLALAVPAFAALVSEPLLLAADSAIVGHLGTDQLAGLGVAANVLGVLTGLSVFLAYGTTGTVARRLGAGDRPGALAGGIDGMVLALLLGAVLALALELLLPTVIGWYGVAPAVAEQAERYLRIAGYGLPSVLLLLASTGVLRGLQDTRTPLAVAVSANLVNVGLNLLLVYGLDLGIAGSATGTLIAQTAAALVLAAVVVRGARRARIAVRFDPLGVLTAARTGAWLVLRTAWLQTAITLTTLTAAGFGAVALASHQVSTSLWTLLAFALDAIAIAAQAIIGRQLGAGRTAVVRRMTRRMIGWGVGAGVVFGLALLLTRPLYAPLFSPDPGVRALLAQVVVVLAVTAPVAGVVYVLDGVLIGAGDGRYLAFAGACALAAYLPLVLLVRHLDAGLVWLWVGYAGFMVARMITLVLRVRTTGWMRTGR
ncbi:putative MATE family efflux protein [Friedmanniella endophytica]|uniref:Putative MATE family efflux protein n=1 Tax=Microlunatus kandeliicorticis TaxID=1759536 RepID=A0A7W3IRA6_9ACTN|nr:MATE family efflux transporter [Microlunatus kandeliicorticis]MBA8793793.1 putative MATE family efflux protein [Microlunatus kandeliicorticis]